METHSSDVSKWRDFFGTASGANDIFDNIKHAIMIAASDFPTEFLQKRDGIAEKLFTCNLPKKTTVVRDNTTCRPGSEAGEVINNTTTAVTIVTAGKRDDVDVLSDEETRIYTEVLRIKREFDRSCRSQDDSSVSGLCDMLRWLHAMGLSMKILEDTQIVKSVHGIRYKHWPNNNVRGLVRELIEGWRVTIKTTYNARRENSDIIKASTSVDLKNPKKASSTQLVDHHEQVKTQSSDKSVHHRVNPQPSMVRGKENTNNDAVKMKQMKSSEKPERRAQVVQQEGLKRKASELDAPHGTLEASRKLRERYQRVETAKRQRRVQVVDWRDIPRQCLERTRDYPLTTRPWVNYCRR